jgi:hypothetical protein
MAAGSRRPFFHPAGFFRKIQRGFMLASGAFGMLAPLSFSVCQALSSITP